MWSCTSQLHLHFHAAKPKLLLTCYLDELVYLISSCPTWGVRWLTMAVRHVIASGLLSSIWLSWQHCTNENIPASIFWFSITSTMVKNSRESFHFHFMLHIRTMRTSKNFRVIRNAVISLLSFDSFRIWNILWLHCPRVVTSIAPCNLSYLTLM